MNQQQKQYVQIADEIQRSLLELQQQRMLEQTFQRVFGNCQWAVLFVVAQDDSTYARLSFNVGPGGQILIPVEVDYFREFGPTNRQSWDIEFKANIQPVCWHSGLIGSDDLTVSSLDEIEDLALPDEFLAEFEQMEPAERQYVLDELAERPELWDEESEVMYI